jgi:hypothetical protein
LRFPSNRAASVSMSCDLFTSFPSKEPCSDEHVDRAESRRCFAR